MEQIQFTCMQEEKLKLEELKVGVKYMPEVLDDYFEPKAVHDHFMELTKIYHPSGDENRVREYIIDCAHKIDNVKICYYKPDAKDPGERVIILRREGSGNYASSPYITLQAHMDMVCSPDKSIFPLHVFGYYDDNNTKWIKAGDECSVTDPSLGTTLGADDGIGVATILALLEDTNLKDYPIECLFTVQEETDMGGAAGFDKNLLIGRRYINLDAEDAKTIIYGSAATQNVQFEGNVNLESVRTDFITLELSISGLLGGHSGVNINNGRLNAIKVITETLVRLNKRLTKLDGIVGKGITAYDLRLISMNSLTEQEIKDKPVVNKIPTWVKAKITIPRNEKDNFKSDFNAYIAALKVQFQPEENNLECNVEEISSVQNSLDEMSTDALLCLLQQIPHGVIHMIPKNTDVVETSSNLAAINSFELNNDKIVIMALNRSSDSNSLGELVKIQKNIGELFNYEVSASNPSPIWQPKAESDLVEKAKTVYKDIHGDDCNITVIHAGLECGYIANYFKDNIDCISIGPTIVNPHTGGERLNTETVKPFYDTVSDLIKNIDNSQNGTLKAYAQWIAITIAPSGFDLVIRNVTKDQGKFYTNNNKNKEINASKIEGNVIAAGTTYTIYSCGRDASPTGTMGHFELHEYNNEVKLGTYYWNCPYNPIDNNHTYWDDLSPLKYDVKISEDFSEKSGPIGNVTISCSKK